MNFCAAWTRNKPRTRVDQCRVSYVFRPEVHRDAHGCHKLRDRMMPRHEKGGAGVGNVGCSFKAARRPIPQHGQEDNIAGFG